MLKKIKQPIYETNVTEQYKNGIKWIRKETNNKPSEKFYELNEKK